MADTTTELEVLDQIVDVLGGTSSQYETVVPTLRQIKELLGGGGAVPDGAVTFPKLSQDVQDAIEEGGSGYNPSLSVGRADALTGADSTAQWSQRVTEGSGAATVRSVQGAAVGYNQYQVDSYTISAYGLTATVNNGLLTVTGTPNTTATASFALMSGTGLQIPSGHKLLLYNTNNTLRMYVQGLSGYANYGHQFLTADDDTYGKLAISVPITEGQSVNISAHIMLFDLTQMFGAGNEPSTVAEFEAMYPAAYYPYSAPTLKPIRIAGIRSTDAQGNELDAIEWPTQTLRAAGSVADMLYSDHVDVKVGERAYQSGDESDATLRTDGTTTYYPLATPTTTPISPALPMTYKVQADGSESIIVPDGDISAAPLITLAEGESAAELVMDALACIATPDGPTATANHAINTYLTMGGKLYKVTSAIAVGESIVAGTNVAQTTVMSELLALTA